MNEVGTSATKPDIAKPDTTRPDITKPATSKPAQRVSDLNHNVRLVLLVLLLPIFLGLSACQKSTSPLTVSFSASPAEVSVGEPVTLAWRGAGAASCTLTTGQRRATLENCSEGKTVERYEQAGTFLAELTYTAPDGSTLRRETPVMVHAGDDHEDVPQDDGSFTAQQNGLSVTFAAATTPGLVPDDTPDNMPNSALTWDFGDGATGSGARVTHRYEGAGHYLVTLSAGQQELGSQTVTVAQDADDNKIALFSGNGLTAWERAEGGAADWRLEADYFEVLPGQNVGDNSLKTRATFGDFLLHLEFWVPKTLPGTPEQARGNSGVYLQGRYELQILDSYGRVLSGKNDAGAIYEVKNAAQNVSLPPETWQRYDIEFRAARFSAGKKIQDARVSVFWNGRLVQDDTVIPSPTRLGERETGAGVLQGPIVLQDHGYRVRFRNVWLEPL